MSELVHTKDLLEKKVVFFRNKRWWNRTLTQVFVISAATLSGIATVLIGVSESLEQNQWAIAALVASGLSTVVGVWQGILAPRKLWHINNVALSDLDALSRRIKRLESLGSIDENKAKELGDTLEKIIAKADESWTDVYRT